MTGRVFAVQVAVFIAIEMEEYLKVSEVINWQHPEIMKRAHQIALGLKTPIAIAKACFETVRDEIHHSYDYQMNP